MQVWDSAVWETRSPATKRVLNQLPSIQSSISLVSLSLLTLVSPFSFLSSVFVTMSGRNQRVMVQPINIIFKHLQSVRVEPSLFLCPFASSADAVIASGLGVDMQKSKVQIWLYDNTSVRMEGVIVVRCLV